MTHDIGVFCLLLILLPLSVIFGYMLWRINYLLQNC